MKVSSSTNFFILPYQLRKVSLTSDFVFVFFSPKNFSSASNFYTTFWLKKCVLPSNFLYYLSTEKNFSSSTKLGLVKSKFLIKGRTKFGHFQRKVSQNSNSQTWNHTPLQEHAYTSIVAPTALTSPNCLYSFDLKTFLQCQILFIPFPT